MSTRLHIVGGSQGEAKREFSVGFFHDGVRSIGLNKKVSHQFRFLPAFDNNRYRETDAEYATSVLPYRDRNLAADSTGTEGFTSWYYIFRVHNFLGHGNRSYVSPITGHQGNPTGVDPILDCYMLCKKNDALKHLIEKPKNKSEGFNAVITSPKSMPFFNVLTCVDKQWVNAIMYCTISALDDLKGKLALRAGRNDAVISPEWSDYIYGDITHPTQGLMATSRIAKVGTNMIETACVFFSEKDGVLTGAQAAPLDPTTPFGQQALRGRYNLLDPERVIKVATYEEILDYIINDGTIPYNVIEAACSPHVARLPAPPPAARMANAGVPPSDDDVPMGNTPPAFGRPAAPASTQPALAPIGSGIAGFAPTPAAAAAPFPTQTVVATPAATPVFATPPAFAQPVSNTPAFPGTVTAGPGPLPTFAAPAAAAVAEQPRVSNALQTTGGPLSTAEQAEYLALAQEMIASNGKALPDEKMRRMAELGMRVNAVS